ncbi:hypothetical protein U1Q18_051839, partial [Sarracenia purpurea var. burkii]
QEVNKRAQGRMGNPKRRAGDDKVGGMSVDCDSNSSLSLRSCEYYKGPIFTLKHSQAQ